MAELSETYRAACTVVRSFLPIYDPIARRRVRRAARELVAQGPWADEKADSNEAAQLALLHLLWLQREAHRAADAKLFESVALLSRSAIDTCIVGLYCLAVPNAAERINDLNAHNLQKMAEYLPATFVDPHTRASLVKLIGTPKKSPNTFDMVSAIDEAGGDDTAEMLYRAYYAPLSTLFAHGGGVSLLRHVKRDNITDRPRKSWSQRSALHITDSCVGLVAARLAPTRDCDPAPFEDYYEAHRGRTITPLFTMGGTAFAASINWRKVPGSIRAIRQLKAYLASPQAALDDEATREHMIRDLAERCLAPVRNAYGPAGFQLSLDGLVRQTIGRTPEDTAAG